MGYLVRHSIMHPPEYAGDMDRITLITANTAMVEYGSECADRKGV